ncbi:MAG TPA: cation transporter [Saccharospirillum sp.]|nr:cation transporter [Saccharospirillum sp.]
MGQQCCGNNDFDGTTRGYRQALVAVIVINAAMFVVEILGGALSGSQALKADALDFLGDALTYGLSLWVIGRSLRTRASAALFKGITLALMGFWVLGSTIWQVWVLGVPSAGIMGAIGALALVANLVSVLILLRYRDGDSNVRSVWLCSRNDAIGNVAVIGAAVLVAFTASPWPDLVVAALMAGLFLKSSVSIIRQAMGELRQVATS